MRKQAARGAASTSTDAARSFARAQAQATADAGKRAIAGASKVVPGVQSYASWFGRRVVYVLFGMAFLYGLGTSIPGAVARYLSESDKRKHEEQYSIEKVEEGKG